MGLKKTEQREYAKVLFTEKGLSQKEIAIKVGVTEKTVGKWVSENNEEWKKLRKSLLTTKANQITKLYDQLERLNDEIEKRPVVTKSMTLPVKLDKKGNPIDQKPEYDPIVLSNVPTSKEADIITKITNSIQRLEGESSIGETVHVGMDFCDFVRDFDFKMAQEVSRLFDAFIREKLK